MYRSGAIQKTSSYLAWKHFSEVSQTKSRRTTSRNLYRREKRIPSASLRNDNKRTIYDRVGLPARLLGLLVGDPVVDALFEEVEREGTAAEDLVVEGAEVEVLAEVLFCFLAELADFELA